MNEVALLIMAQSWPWSNEIADKRTFNVDILATSSNSDDRKIMKPIEHLQKCYS